MLLSTALRVTIIVLILIVIGLVVFIAVQKPKCVCVLPTSKAPRALSETLQAPCETLETLIGGWCQCAYGNKSTWGPDINTLLPGGFQGDGAIGPSNPPKGSTTIPNIFMTIGGDGVLGDKCLDVITQIQNAETVGATGICFDMEGCLKGQLSNVKNFVTQARKTHPKWKFILTPQGDEDPIPYRDNSTFDYVAPMLYWGNDTYDTVTFERIQGWIQNWLNAGWPPSKLILTFQSYSASTHQDILRNLAIEVTSKGYAGLLGWPSGNSSIDSANIQTIKKILQ